MRSAVAFAVMSLVLSGVLSIATYQIARWYLLDKREELALRQATLNAVAIKGQISAGDGERDDLISALQTSDARALLRYDDTWYAAVVQFGESKLPESLSRLVADRGAARQRVVIDGESYLAYGFTIPDEAAEYYEFVSAAEYQRTLSVLAVALLVAASITTVGGAAAGWFISRRVLRPLTTVAESARSISKGDLSHRIDVGDDPDLRVVANAFNEMAGLGSNANIASPRTSATSCELRSRRSGLRSALPDETISPSVAVTRWMSWIRSCGISPG
jgi:methyl-accepting chemotaxis protein